MITITVDEKACVGCELCVDTCPTKVFAYDQANAVLKVDKGAACFGCLACSEICPAAAISHDGVALSDSTYADSYALALADKLATGVPRQIKLTDAGQKRSEALGDLAVTLLSVASVLKQTLGAGVGAVGLLAGRTLGNQLPRYRVPKDFQEVLEIAKDELSPA